MSTRGVKSKLTQFKKRKERKRLELEVLNVSVEDIRWDGASREDVNILRDITVVLSRLQDPPISPCVANQRIGNRFYVTISGWSCEISFSDIYTNCIDPSTRQSVCQRITEIRVNPLPESSKSVIEATIEMTGTLKPFIPNRRQRLYTTDSKVEDGANSDIVRQMNMESVQVIDSEHVKSAIGGFLNLLGIVKCGPPVVIALKSTNSYKVIIPSVSKAIDVDMVYQIVINERCNRYRCFAFVLDVGIVPKKGAITLTIARMNKHLRLGADKNSTFPQRRRPDYLYAHYNSTQK